MQTTETQISKRLRGIIGELQVLLARIECADDPSVKDHKIKSAFTMIVTQPGKKSLKIAQAIDVELKTFETEYSPALRAMGCRCGRGCLAGWFGPTQRIPGLTDPGIPGDLQTASARKG